MKDEILYQVISTTADDEINQNCVAKITEWKNHCAVSATAIFLIDAMFGEQLDTATLNKLTVNFNNYYGTHLSASAFKNLFASYITHPGDQQVVLGKVLKDQLVKESVNNEVDIFAENLLSDEAFTILAKSYGFNVRIDEKITNDQTDWQLKPNSQQIITNEHSKLAMRILYANQHYDLIMDPKKAQQHNNAQFKLGDQKISLGDDDAVCNDYIGQLAKRAALAPVLKGFFGIALTATAATFGILAGIIPSLCTTCLRHSLHRA